MLKDHSETVSFLESIVKKGGPEKKDYQRFTSIVDNIEASELDEFRNIISPMLKENSLIGHAYVKPFGYPGDFLLIDKIYQYNINQDPAFRNWDVFFQEQPGANAVRNRKDYFISYCRKLSERISNPRVLILGSGPASDVHELLVKHNLKTISFDLIDFDQTAIDFSMEKNKGFGDQVSYYRINALRYNSYKLYDLIWSAGLFDYFKDKHFTFLVRKYYNCLSDEGEMVISNFSTRNPTRKLMENLSDWFLNLRTESDLFRIASEAGVNKECVSVDKEQLGINLFLKVRKCDKND